MIPHYLQGLGFGGSNTGPSTDTSVSDSSIGLREAIAAYLASLAGLTALVSDRIYLGAPDGTGGTYPYLTYEIHKGRAGGASHGFGRTYGRNLSGQDGNSTAAVIFLATSNRESDCIRIARVLGLAFEDFKGNMAGVTVLDSQIEVEYDAEVNPPPGQTQHLHQIGVIYRIVHRLTPATA